MPITFPVSDVTRAREPLRMHADPPRELLGRPVEAWGSSGATTLFPAQRNGLLEAVHWAFASHYPLVLTPDTVWLAIAQGFATHIRENAERFRQKFVRHEGRATISVRRDDFIKGAAENPWPEAFSAFSDAIAEHIGRQRDLVVCDFSTTGPCERAASEIVLMDAMQNYFAYEMCSMCGIPEITLEGTLEDWKSIRRRAQALGEYELDFWLKGLVPVLDKLVATAEGRIDRTFWRSLFKLNDNSGGPYVTGWINVLFPYLRSEGRTMRNDAVTSWAAGMDAHFGGGPRQSSIPGGLSIVPFKWKCFDRTFPMELLGGFVGVTEDADTLALRPAIGWAVRDAVEEGAKPPSPPEPFEWTRRDTLHVPPERGAVVIAGKVARGRSFTWEDLLALRERIEHLDPDIVCALLGEDQPATAYAPMSGELIIGVPLASGSRWDRAPVAFGSVAAALRKVRAVPASTWAALAAVLPGGLSDEMAIHLGCFGEDVDASVISGEAGVVVAKVGADGGRRAVVDPGAGYSLRLERV